MVGFSKVLNMVSKQATYITSAVRSLFCHLKNLGQLSKKNQMTLDIIAKSSDYSKNVRSYIGIIRYH